MIVSLPQEGTRELSLQHRFDGDGLIGLIKERGSIQLVIQVCAKLNSDNKIREIEGLFEAMVYFDLNEGYLITIDEDDELIRDGRLIRIVSFRKFIAA